MKNNLSKNVTYEEATQSYTAKKCGFDNTPNDKQLSNMVILANQVFEPLRKGLGNSPINIGSFYRGKKLNEHIGGSVKSQHMALNGAAMDIDNDGFSGPTNLEIFHYIKDTLDFDQIIAEYPSEGKLGWVHVSYVDTSLGGKNRRNALIATKEQGKTRYYTYTAKRMETLLA